MELFVPTNDTSYFEALKGLLPIRGAGEPRTEEAVGGADHDFDVHAPVGHAEFERRVLQLVGQHVSELVLVGGHNKSSFLPLISSIFISHILLMIRLSCDFEAMPSHRIA